MLGLDGQLLPESGMNPPDPKNPEEPPRRRKSSLLGCGFSRVIGKDSGEALYGVDQDAHAFERFIRRFLTKSDRWNSPKYLFGESSGTPRSAVLSALLDLNGKLAERVAAWRAKRLAYSGMTVNTTTP
jgi:carboxypeptidase C (cathepsin A)